MEENTKHHDIANKSSSEYNEVKCARLISNSNIQPKTTTNTLLADSYIIIYTKQ